MSLLWRCSWAWSLSLPPQPLDDSDSTPLRLRLQRLTNVPFFMENTCYHESFCHRLNDHRLVMYQLLLSSERNTTLSNFDTEENSILLDVPSSPFSDSVLDSMHFIMSGNRVWSRLPVDRRRELLREIASALVDVISPLRNTSTPFELVIAEEMFTRRPTPVMPRVIPLITLANLDEESDSEEGSSEESLVAQESFDLAQQNVVARPMPKILLDSLVTEVYSGTDAEEECAICKEEYVGGVEIIRLPCSHRFHGDCIARWFQERDTCPICRYRIHM